MFNHPDSVNVYILYAESDEALKHELENHLSPLERRGYIKVWHEGLIQAGENKNEAIAKHLRTADIILLLISANFLSPECYDKYTNELQIAYERQRKGEVKIIPVILRYCDWQLDFLASLNPLPRGGYPVNSDHWENPDKAFREITLELQEIADDFKKKLNQLKNKVEESKDQVASKIFAATANHVISNTFKNLQVQKQEVSQEKDQSNIAEEQKTQNIGREAVAIHLINELLDILINCDSETAIDRFKLIGHSSLFCGQQLDISFKKHDFNSAISRVKLYKRPVEILSQKSTGRKKIGIGDSKENGEEEVYAIARAENLGGMPGQVRIFFPADGSSAKISRLSL